MTSDHGMASERYLNHPTFGMLYRVAPAGEGRDVYATSVSYTHLTLPTRS